MEGVIALGIFWLYWRITSLSQTLNEWGVERGTWYNEPPCMVCFSVEREVHVDVLNVRDPLPTILLFFFFIHGRVNACAPLRPS